MGGRLLEQRVILSSLREEEIYRLLYTTDGIRKKVILLTRDDVAHLYALQTVGLRYIRIGYDSEGNWLAIDLDNVEIFSCDNEYNLIDVIRTPIETVLNWAPTAERLMLLTQRLNRKELSAEELPRKGNTPTFEEMIEWISHVKAGVVTRENVSTWAGRVLWQSENEMIEGSMLDALNVLSVMDMKDEDGSYFYHEEDFDEWIEQLRRGMRQDVQQMVEEDGTWQV